jgi:hypothetical protein
MAVSTPREERGAQREKTWVQIQMEKTWFQVLLFLGGLVLYLLLGLVLW